MMLIMIKIIKWKMIYYGMETRMRLALKPRKPKQTQSLRFIILFSNGVEG